MTDFTIKRPFGPPIYYSVLTTDFVNVLQNIAVSTKENNKSIGKALAGNIELQCEAIMDNLQRDTFFKHLQPHIYNTLRGFEEETPTGLDLSNMKINLGGGPWINFQQAGEFNPYHSHSGHLSAVIYIDVPEDIKQENDNSTVETNLPRAGMIEFIFGNDMTQGYGVKSNYVHQPKTGEIFIFPAGLKHLVYPFKSNVERISMSFNIYNN
jgi:uncharacterized protein (TIGR02466 family)